MPSDQPRRFPPLPRALESGSLSGTLRLFGPGAIVACVTIGNGEIIFASRGGAIFGYALMWCFVLTALVKGIQVYSGARFITLTGRHPLEIWAKLPGPRAWLVWLLFWLTIPFMPFYLGGGLPRILGDFTNWVVGLDPASGANPDLAARAWGTFYIVVAITFTLVQSYGFLERVQTAMVALLLFCMFVAAVVSSPDLAALVAGAVTPRVPPYEPWVMEKLPDLANRSRWLEVIVYLGAVGGGTQDYLGYLGMLREKTWGMIHKASEADVSHPVLIDTSAENLAIGRRWLRAPLVDVGFSFTAVLLFTLCFAVLGATMLNPRHLVPGGFDLLTLQAGFLVQLGQSPAMQWFLGWVYRAGVFFAFFGTIYGAYELYTRTTRECFIALFPSLRTVSMRKFRVATTLWCGIPGLLLLWFTNKDPVEFLTPAIIVSSTVSCGVWCFAMLWADRVALPEGLQMRLPLRLSLFGAGVVLIVFGIAGLIEYVVRML